MRGILPSALFISAFLVLPAQAAAQRAFAGVSVGLEHVAQSGPEDSAPRPSLGVRVGVGVSRSVRIVLDATAHGLGDEEPRLDDYQVGHFVRVPSVLRTDAILLGVQVDVARGAYLRPELGVSRQSFASYLISGAAQSADVDHEWGGAAGVSAGYRLRAGSRVSVAVEATAAVSSGEDSSSSRTLFGIRVVPTIGL